MSKITKVSSCQMQLCHKFEYIWTNLSLVSQHALQKYLANLLLDHVSTAWASRVPDNALY